MDYLEKIRQSIIDSMRTAEQRGTVDNTLDFLKGAGRAYSADIAGTPVDLRNMASSALSPEGGGNPYAQGIRNLIGRPDDKYSSDYFADKMGVGGEGLAYNAGNMIGPEGIKSLFKNALSPNVRKIFAGEKAANAPLKDLDTAKEMTKSGADPRQIWKNTGWFQGKDGNWRWEIDDSNYDAPIPKSSIFSTIKDRLLNKYSDYIGPLRHAELRANYPGQIGYGKISVPPERPNYFGRSIMGQYDPEFNSIDVMRYRSRNDLNNTLIHELQHNVQNVEGWHNPYGPPLSEMSYKDYLRQFDEVEARAAEKRRKYSPEKRRQVFPEDSYDIKPERIVVDQKTPYDPNGRVWGNVGYEELPKYAKGGLASLKRRK